MRSFAVKAFRAGVVTAVVALGISVMASPASADQPQSCTTSNSGYYCYWTGTYGSGSLYEDYQCFVGTIHSYPSYMWDKVHSWTNMQSGGGATIDNWNYVSPGNYQWVFGEGLNSYQWSVATNSADSLQNHASC